MAAKILSGHEISAEIKAELVVRVERLKEKDVKPSLLLIRVGEDPASTSYVKQKRKTAEALGIGSRVLELPAHVEETTLLTVIGRGNADPAFHGVLVQLPLPSHISEARVANAIRPLKDVDCFHPRNVGKLHMGDPYLIPCTPHGIQQMLLRSGYEPAGRHIVICGRSNLVGRPLAALLSQKNPRANATVTLCHSGTPNLPRLTAQADILVSAIGSPGFIKPNMVRDGAVVIDVGVTRIDDPEAASGYRLVGDVDILSTDDDFATVPDKAAALTPVPGGVGPMTVTMLMWNTVIAAERQLSRTGDLS
ncbi:MAG: bifunctional 5,10-methylene-tetrahydrofolate dehydrogenase/5,10-methylene-tetrahydrofolate cyclohydrolase [Candidatus Komeilibacteria bacterium RIFCSPLOWO2_01_FULL_53_11]|uniref:Bifunctional protein FolD n=1 Tax=Candidatus Komeilibacteria bacterium RIFCSPLOWO2_01_FULL_53_11 TaxID=1798552 RepID=A0A1G2BUV7_9BACT|nr:MAG: bifunctional 5,10-methylene-tetrahydrofolate dehydrogenase/5,10-methylene-tetrahydrofolate cyclohydrolase [Candidatus Komeilibacteria bacterium RIFCSPLOWO2_01_FULL_53_11]